MSESSSRLKIRLATYRPSRFPRASIGVIIWLTLVWALLWGEISSGNIVAGFLVALFVTTVSPLPASQFDGRFRPGALLRLGYRFLADIVVASWQISVFVFKRKQPVGAVIRVQTRAHSDTFLTALAGMTTLVPGSVVVEAHRGTGTLYIHVFDVEMSGGLDQAHQTVLDQEERILRAFGSHDQLIDAGFVPSGKMLGRLPTPYSPPAEEAEAAS